MAKKVKFTYVCQRTSYNTAEMNEAQAELDKVIRYLWSQLSPENAQELFLKCDEIKPTAD